MTGTDTAVIAAAHAIERCGMFRRVFHPGDLPPGENTHPAAVEFARAALEAQLLQYAEHDARIVAAERERCAQLADEHQAAIAVEGDWSTLLPFGDILRAQP